MAKQKQLTLLHSKTPKVYKHRKLNDGNFSDFTLNEYQVFLFLVSKIGGVDERGKYIQNPELLKREHVLTAKEFSDVFGVALHQCYTILRNAVRGILRKQLMIQKSESNEIWEINICSMAKYCKKEGRITFKFTDDIMPYLLQAKEKFILYNLKEISSFGSFYTIRLYELLMSFKYTGWIQKNIQELRVLLGVKANKLVIYNNFKNKVLNHAINEINKYYKINLKFTEIKEGRKVTGIRFEFKKSVQEKNK
jgi:plasmid replication initiation protein